MLKVNKRPSLMCVSTQAKPGQLDLKLDNGLVVGHSYTVVAVEKVWSTSEQTHPRVLFSEG